jgi:hypothetical protein
LSAAHDEHARTPNDQSDGITVHRSHQRLLQQEKIVQPVADLGEARIGARFVLVAARRPTDADGTDRFVVVRRMADV